MVNETKAKIQSNLGAVSHTLVKQVIIIHLLQGTQERFIVDTRLVTTTTTTT